MYIGVRDAAAQEGAAQPDLRGVAILYRIMLYSISWYSMIYYIVVYSRDLTLASGWDKSTWRKGSRPATFEALAPATGSD